MDYGIPPFCNMIRPRITAHFVGEENFHPVNSMLYERSTRPVKLYVPLFTPPEGCRTTPSGLYTCGGGSGHGHCRGPERDRGMTGTGFLLEYAQLIASHAEVDGSGISGALPALCWSRSRALEAPRAKGTLAVCPPRVKHHDLPQHRRGLIRKGG
jgi:hypothetical protein